MFTSAIDRESQCALINALTDQNEKLEALPQWSHIVEVVRKFYFE